MNASSSVSDDLNHPSILVRCAARVKARLAGKSIPSAGADAYVGPPVTHAVPEQPSAGGSVSPLVESVRALIEQKPEALAAVAGVLRAGDAVSAPSALVAPVAPAQVAKAAAPSDWDRCVALAENETCPSERGRLGAHLNALEAGEDLPPFQTRAARDAEIGRLQLQMAATADPAERHALASKVLDLW
jgi:hypothetical protein